MRVLFSSAKPIPVLRWQSVKRIGSLGLIILLHVGFFHALQSGLPRHAAQAAPHEMLAALIAPEPTPKPELPEPRPATPKTVPVAKKATRRPAPVLRAANPSPSAPAIATPPAEPLSEEPQEAAAPAASQPAAAPTPPKTVSGVEYIQPPQPEYPPVSKRLGEEGKVMLRILVNEKGQAERVEVHKSSGSLRLDEAARQAASRARFKPYLEDGRAVAVYALVPINFSIQ